MTAYLFPGQGAQFPGMAKELYDQNQQARSYFEQANDLLGFRLTDVMFSGSEEALQQTNVTQPAIFVHSVVLALTTPGFAPQAVAGHSLGEFSALVAAGSLSFTDGLRLVARRAAAMQEACSLQPSTMAAILGLPDSKVEEICDEVGVEAEETVVPANYNSPGQLVISGTVAGVSIACERLRAAGARRALVLPVGGAFHSPLMEPARRQLAEAIAATPFSDPLCPVYQNVTAEPTMSVEEIRKNLIAQLTAPVCWTQTIQHMQRDGYNRFVECGPGRVLQGLVRKISPELETAALGES